MKALTLRSQVLAVMAFLWLYALGVGGAYWIQSRAHGRLEESFQHDLAVLARLPRLRDGLRQLDQWTDRYLLTGQARWLDKRQDALERVRQTEGVLAGLRSEGLEGDILQQLHRQFADYLSQQNQWISRRRAGRLSPGEAQRLIGRHPDFDAMTALLVRMKDANVAELERRREAVGAASRVNLALILLTGLLACGLMTFFLWRYVVGPLESLHRYAAQWALGRPWDLGSPHAGPEIRGLLATMKGLTDRVNGQYEKEHELAQLKAQLVSMVSHEFNNALATLGGFVLLLQESEPKESDGPQRGEYYTILNSTVRLLTLAVKNLLDMGRIEAGKFQVRPRPMHIRPLVKQALESLALLAQRRGIEIRQEFPDQPLCVRADPETLAMVVTNLLSNAIKYTPEQGRIAFGVVAEPGGARVYCEDTGIGISAEDQQKIFSGYYRTEEGRKAAKGFGLGLTLCASIVEAHGSRLEVASEPGKGSRFSFVLPLAEEEPGPHGRPLDPAAPGPMATAA
ncbi:MAG: ATP-binding protein [Elusimicrobia bacterium]|nr:ATP-binding protein [Elusimicrobiota bacterium]